MLAGPRQAAATPGGQPDAAPAAQDTHRLRSARLPPDILADYARNPVNLLILVLVPAGFVAGAAGSLAEISRLLSGAHRAPGAAVQTVTAGWAGAFIAAIAAYFQIRAARAADRRLILAGLPARRLAAARAIAAVRSEEHRPPSS
jgi:hypothetical protein